MQLSNSLDEIPFLEQGPVFGRAEGPMEIPSHVCLCCEHKIEGTPSCWQHSILFTVDAPWYEIDVLSVLFSGLWDQIL